MLSSNAATILKRMLARKERVVSELAAAARTLGPELAAESKRIMQERIYNVPIPLKKGAKVSAKVRNSTTKGAAGLWQRTGNLKRSEGWKVEGVTLFLTNNADYSEARYYAGTPRGRKIHTPGVQSVQWQEEAITKKRARILEVRRQAVLRALRVS